MLTYLKHEDYALTREVTATVLGSTMIITAFILQAIIGQTTLVAVLFGLSFVVGGYYKAKLGIIETKRDKHLNVEILMIIAAISAFITGNFGEGAILILIFSISGVLETYAIKKSEKELKGLMDLSPKTARLLIDGNEKEVPIEDVKPGQTVVVKPGDMVPVDGKITSGKTTLKEAAITGESMPVHKSKNDKVYASSFNVDGMIHVTCLKDPKESIVQKIVDFVQEAQADKSEAQSRVEIFERYYVYVVILMALTYMILPTVFGWLTASEAFYRGTIVLVVGSPCALVAAIAPAQLSSLSNASKKRILIKGGSHLETLKNIKTIVFDKTGTLTTGEPEVKAVYIDPDEDVEYLHQIIKTLESQSTHPLAEAMIKHFQDTDTLKDVDTKEISGAGVSSTIEDHTYEIGRFDHPKTAWVDTKINALNDDAYSHVGVYKDKKMIGFITLEDTLRPNIKQLIQGIQALNINVVLMTGDHAYSAKHIANILGINTIHSDCYPEDKLTLVKDYQKTGGVLMLGDGINDAPALTQANVSIAMGAGTDVSLETSDIVLMDNELSKLNTIFKLSKRMNRIITQNVIFSIAVIMFLLISNLFGIISLPFGVLAHEVSTILVILNSLRLLV